MWVVVKWKRIWFWKLPYWSEKHELWNCSCHQPNLHHIFFKVPKSQIARITCFIDQEKVSRWFPHLKSEKNMFFFIKKRVDGACQVRSVNTVHTSKPSASLSQFLSIFIKKLMERVKSGHAQGWRNKIKESWRASVNSSLQRNLKMFGNWKPLFQKSDFFTSQLYILIFGSFKRLETQRCVKCKLQE